LHLLTAANGTSRQFAATQHFVALGAKRTLDRAPIGIANGQGAIVKNLGSRPLAAPAGIEKSILNKHAFWGEEFLRSARMTLVALVAKSGLINRRELSHLELSLRQCLCTAPQGPTSSIASVGPMD
jgi:hypothetical protein